MNTYRSAVDAWLVTILLAVLLTVLVAVTTSFENPQAKIAGVVSTMISGALMFYGLLWPCAYQLTHETLAIRMRLIKKQIPYRTIRSVESTRSMESAPALSLTRLRVRHESGYVLIW